MERPVRCVPRLTSFEVTVQNPVDGKTFSLVPAKDQATAEAELKKVQDAKTLEAYFGEEAAKAIVAILGENAEISLDEFLAVVAEGYEDGMGAATVSAKLATPYEKGEKVAASIGIPKDGAYAWNVYEGEGLEDGAVQFIVDAETMLAVLNGSALFAICSK